MVLRCDLRQCNHSPFLVVRIFRILRFDREGPANRRADRNSNKQNEHQFQVSHAIQSMLRLTQELGAETN